jgi:hypothetical protein
MSSSPESPTDCLGHPAPADRGSATGDVRKAYRDDEYTNERHCECGALSVALRGGHDPRCPGGAEEVTDEEVWEAVRTFERVYGHPLTVARVAAMRVTLERFTAAHRATPREGGAGAGEAVDEDAGKSLLGDAPSVLATMDDGSSVLLDSYAGGAHPAGTWGRLWLRFRAADGTETVREYVSTHPADLKQTGTIPFER